MYYVFTQYVGLSFKRNQSNPHIIKGSPKDIQGSFVTKNVICFPNKVIYVESIITTLWVMLLGHTVRASAYDIIKICCIKCNFFFVSNTMKNI